MPSIRQKVLKSLWEALEKRGAKDIYRIEEHPEKLLKRGFKKSRFITPEEPEAMYWAHSLPEAKELKYGPEYNRGPLTEEELKFANIKGYILPRTKVKTYSNEEWGDTLLRAEKESREWYPPQLAYREGVQRKLTKNLKKEADIAIAPDFSQSPELEQVMQLKRGKVLAKIGDRYKMLGIAGLTGAGAMGLSDLLEPSEAEASPIGKAFKTATRPLLQKAPKSRTVKDLVGQTFQGETIKDVVKGKGDWRYILTKEGNTIPVTKDVLADLERAGGTIAQEVKFAAKDQESQLLQAYKSLAYHESRLNPFATRKATEDHFKYYSQNVKATGLEMPDMCLIEYKGKTFTLPREYAIMLQKEGTIKILKGLGR